MFVILSALCAGAFAALCSEVAVPATTTPPPAEFVPVERDPDITSKLQEMLDSYAQLCRRNIPEACANIRALTTLRADLYFTSQRCAQAEPQDCGSYLQHRSGVLASHDQFKADAANINQALNEPTAAALRMQEQIEAQRQRDEAFKRRMDALEKAQTEFLKTIGIGQ